MGRLVWDTYPKSGSAWLARTLDLAFPKSEIVWGQHRIATLSKEQKVITSIRNPQDCVASYMVFFNHYNPDGLLDWYSRFMQGTIESASRIFIARFEELTSNPSLVVNQYASMFSLPTPETITKNQVSNKTRETHPQHLPSTITPERIKANEMVMESPELQKALDLFNKASALAHSGTNN